MVCVSAADKMKSSVQALSEGIVCKAHRAGVTCLSDATQQVETGEVACFYMT